MDSCAWSPLLWRTVPVLYILRMLLFWRYIYSVCNFYAQIHNLILIISGCGANCDQLLC